MIIISPINVLGLVPFLGGIVWILDVRMRTGSIGMLQE